MKFKVSVVGGAGHIGLPFSCFISNKGIETLIVDVSNESIEKILQGTPPFHEHGLETELKKALNSGLSVTNDLEKIKESNIVIITLGTSTNSDDIKNFNNLVDEVVNVCEGETVILLRSTLASNTMNTISSKYLNKKELSFIYAPERIAEGKAFEELPEIPQIIGTKNYEDYKLISSFFNILDVDTINLSFEEAEYLKLFLNAYRYIQFSTLNFFENIAIENSLNFRNILESASKDYPRLTNVPDSGLVGGPCLIKDSKAFAESYPKSKNLINEFLSINENFIENIINRCKVEFIDKKIIQLGLTFKPESDDLRDSQAVVLYEKLSSNGFEVKAYDPFLQNEEDWDSIKNFSNNIIIATNHSEFKNYDLTKKKVILIGKN